MAAFDAPRAAFNTVGLFGRIGQFLADAVSAVAVWNDTRVTRNTLARLSDRELDDIGFSRGDIDDMKPVTRRKF